jgi:hypothetical protein
VDAAEDDEVIARVDGIVASGEVEFGHVDCRVHRAA